MFSSFRYACPPFRDDTSSAPLHPEKRRTEEREIETNGKRRDTECSRTHQQGKKMMNRRLNSRALHMVCTILITHILLFPVNEKKKYKTKRLYEPPYFVQKMNMTI
jgi:hypothetical protein